MDTQLISLLQGLQRPDDNERKAAEEALSQLIASDPSSAAMSLLSIASTDNYPISDRQSALLCLKRLVPIHWSAGFESFTGPAVTVEAKEHIRPELLRLATLSPDSKIRSGAAYAATQIAAVDYPDEWPSLLETLYQTVMSGESGVLGALALLQELFDDLVTEEQFFAGVGEVTISHCMKLMANTSIHAQIRTAAANLYKSCLLKLQSPDVLDDETKSHVVEQHLTQMAALLTNLLQNNSMDIYDLQLRTVLYTISHEVTEFPPEMFEDDAKLALQREAVKDLAETTKLYVQVVVNEDESPYHGTDPEIIVPLTITNLIIEQLQLLSALNEHALTTSNNVDPQAVFNFIVACSMIPLSTESEYAADVNPFVTEETGLSPDYTARNAVFDFITELSPDDIDLVFEYFISRLNTNDWREKEAVLFCLDALFRHDTDIKTRHSVVELLNTLMQLTDESNHFTIRCRSILMIPAFFTKFRSQLGGEFPVKAFLECLRQASNASEDIIKASFLISLTYFDSVFEVERAPDECQRVIVTIIASLLEDAEEDTPSMLTEALTMSLKIHKNTNVDAIRLLFQIAGKDSANLQMILNVEETLEELLAGPGFREYAEAALPGLFTTLENANPEFSNELSFVLQVLPIFFNNADGMIPDDIVTRANPAICRILLESTDEQILQVGGESYLALIQHSNPNLYDINIVLQVLSKFLDPELSDTAATNVGSLVVEVLSKFSEHVSSIIPQLLEATTRRLLTSKKMNTTEDLLSVLCLMINTDVAQTVAFLQQNEIQAVFNVWFANFPTLSGIDRIVKNVEALTKVFYYVVEHPQEFQFTVDGDEIVDVPGDVIITRSMRKNMTKQFTQVSVAFKIVKILVAELKDQAAQHDHSHEVFDAVAEDDEEGWEDVDAIGGDFDTLKGYVDDDVKEQDDDLKANLIGFFKRVAASEVPGFRDIYNALTDEEKQVLAENIV